MERRMTIVEVCPACGSLDVRVAEPRWFSVELDRRSELAVDDGWVERLEFGCRDCGVAWE